nr:IS3 family transposase [uncultured Flavobacterium sp.]
MELRCQYDLGIMLNHMNLARSSYYYYEKKHQRDDKYKDIKKLIQHIYDKHKGRFGYRRITLEIKNRGILIKRIPRGSASG